MNNYVGITATAFGIFWLVSLWTVVLHDDVDVRIPAFFASCLALAISAWGFWLIH